MIMPRFYYQRGKKSDRDWIEVKMEHIPAAERQEVAHEYELKFMDKVIGGRGVANKWLLSVAKKHWEANHGEQ